MELEKIKAAYQELEQRFEALKKNQGHAVQSEKLAALGKLVSDMAHEINNPLMIISGRVELSLMDDLKDKGVKANLKTIQEQCIRITDMIRKLLIFSRPSKGTVHCVSINDLLEATVKSFEERNPLEHVTLQKNFSPALPKIELDDKQMQDVFMNLMQNSVEAMPEGGKVTISTSQEGNDILINVSDTGRGISQADIKKIFDPFFSTKEKGVGLGLSMCYGIVKVHGGELRYESTPNQGTTASIVLPVSRMADA